MQLGRAGDHLPMRGALLLSCTQASVAELRRQTLATDDQQAPAVGRSALLPLLHLWRAVARPSLLVSMRLDTPMAAPWSHPRAVAFVSANERVAGRRLGNRSGRRTSTVTGLPLTRPT